MTLMDEIGANTMDRDIHELQVRSDLAQRNPWHGGDVLAPEYTAFLSSLASRPASGSGPVAPTRNAWRESLEQLG